MGNHHPNYRAPNHRFERCLLDVRQNSNARDATSDVTGIGAVKNVSDTGDLRRSLGVWGDRSGWVVTCRPQQRQTPVF